MKDFHYIVELGQHSDNMGREQKLAYDNYAH